MNPTDLEKALDYLNESELKLAEMIGQIQKAKRLIIETNEKLQSHFEFKP